MVEPLRYGSKFSKKKKRKRNLTLWFMQKKDTWKRERYHSCCWHSYTKKKTYHKLPHQVKNQKWTDLEEISSLFNTDLYVPFWYFGCSFVFLLGVSNYHTSVFQIGLGCFLVQSFDDMWRHLFFQPNSRMKGKRLFSFHFQVEFPFPPSRPSNGPGLQI